MISKRFIKSSLLYTLAGSLPTASAIILLPFYLLFLSPDNFGILAIYTAFSVLIQILVTFSFDTSIYIYFHDFKDDQQKLSVYASSVFGFMLLGGLIIGLIFIFSGDLLFSAIFRDRPISFYPYGLLSVATGIFQSIFKVYSSFLQTRERPEIFFRLNVICFTLVAVATLGGLYFFPQTLTGPVAGRTIAFGISAIWVFVLIVREFGFHFDYNVLRSSFDFNRSSFVYQIQLWSINYFDRFLMIFFLPLSVIGVYDFAMKCMMALDFIIGGLYNSFYPKVISIMRTMDEKKSTPEVNRYYHGLIGVVMILVCGSIVFFSLIIDAGWIGKGYEESIQYFPWIGIYYLIRSIRYYFAFPIGILKFSKPLPIIYLIISILRIGIILLLMQFGIYAVILSAIVSNGLEIFLLWLFLRSKFEYRFNAFKIIFTPLLLALVVAAVVLAGMSSVWMYMIFPLACVGLLWWVYRKELKLLNISNIWVNYKYEANRDHQSDHSKNQRKNIPRNRRPARKEFL